MMKVPPDPSTVLICSRKPATADPSTALSINCAFPLVSVLVVPDFGLSVPRGMEVCINSAAAFVPCE